MSYKHSKEELRGMTIKQLRLMDITTVEQEADIQEVLNEKLALQPQIRPVNTSDVPDIRTPEDEAKWQKILDERRAKAKGITLNNSAADVSNGPEQTAAPDVDPNVPMMDHVVTQEDLDNNPELVQEGVKVGETIQIPVEDSQEDSSLTFENLDKMVKPELVKVGKALGLELDLKLKKPEMIKQILDAKK